MGTVNQVNKSFGSKTGALVGRVKADGHSFRVETTPLNGNGVWKYVARYTNAQVAGAHLQSILDAN